MIPKIMHFVWWLPLRMVFNVFLKFKVVGLENIKNIKGPAIFVGNHKSYYDPFIIGIGLPWFSMFHPILYFTGDEYFKRPLFKLVFKLFGAFPGEIDRGIKFATKKPPRDFKAKTISWNFCRRLLFRWAVYREEKQTYSKIKPVK